MKDYKICVYGICKNEEKFVDRFMDTLEEIKDHVYILDTGSTDNTVEKFKSRGAHINTKTYDKFEFDRARNDSLDLIPKDYDICISLDIDDCIEPGFVEKIKKAWKEDTTKMRYNYYIRFDSLGNSTYKIMVGKIHRRDLYKWKYPIHETLYFIGDNEQVINMEDIIIRHRPDPSKSRAFYTDLLEEYVSEHSDDTRNLFFLARDYKKNQKWEKCIETSLKYLENPNATYKPERSKTMCFLAGAYRALGKYKESEKWALKASEEFPDYREPYVILMKKFYTQKNYTKAIFYAKEALKIKEQNKLIQDEAYCWDGTIYEYLALIYYFLRDYEKANYYIEMDIQQNPHNKKLRDLRDKIVKEKEKRIIRIPS